MVTRSDPHTIQAGNFEPRTMLAAVLRLWGQPSGAPREVADQSYARMRAPMAPPPARNGASDVVGLSSIASAALGPIAPIPAIIPLRKAQGRTHHFTGAL